MTVASILLLLLVSVAENPAEKAVAEEKKQLEGGWMVQCLGNGSIITAESAPILLFAPEKITFNRAKIVDKKPMLEELFQATYTLDLSKKPRQIDMVITTGKDKGKTIRGLYHFKGNRLRICLAGLDKERPRKFIQEEQVTDFLCQKLVRPSEEELFSVPLALAESGQPLDARAKETLILRVSEKGEVTAPGQKKPLADLEQFLQRRRNEYPGEDLVALQVHHEAPWVAFHPVLSVCRKVGYIRFELRVVLHRAKVKKDENDLDSLLIMGLPEGRLQVKLGPAKTGPTVRLRSDGDGLRSGSIDSFGLERPMQDEEILRGPHPERERELSRRLKQVEKDCITLKPQGTIRHELVIEMIDLCNKIGFKDVILAAPFDFRIEKPADLVHLKGSADVHEMTLSGKDITDDVLKHVRNLPRLERLTLREVKTSNAGLEHLSGLPQLRGLVIDRAPIDDDGLKHLKGLTGLKWLVLDGTRVGGNGLAHLKDSGQLRELYLRNSEIHAGFTKHLKLFPNLRFLDVALTTTGDGELKLLPPLPRLERLLLNKTRVTDSGVRSLQEARPRLAIYR
jgi:uncharacterized protein (TIGR03067 family)